MRTVLYVEPVEDIFGLEVPEGLKLESFGEVVSEVLDRNFDQGKWSLEGVVGEAVNGVSSRISDRRGYVRLHHGCALLLAIS
jgi:hypothetical protein